MILDALYISHFSLFPDLLHTLLRNVIFYCRKRLLKIGVCILNKEIFKGKYHLKGFQVLITTVVKSLPKVLHDTSEISRMLNLINKLGSACGVMVIVVGNGHSDTSSNPGRD